MASLVGIVTVLRAEKFRVCISAGATSRMFLEPIHNSVNWILQVKRPGLRDVSQTTHLHLVPRLISGTVPCLPVYVFMICTGTNLLFPNFDNERQEFC